MAERGALAGLFGQARQIALLREDFSGNAAIAWVKMTDYATLARYSGEFLHPREIEVFNAFKIHRRQASYLLGRFAAKSALAEHWGQGFAASAVAIAAGVFNQPVVEGNPGHPAGVSISHSDHLACGLAFPEAHPMAIDVEEVDTSRTHIMLTQMGPYELDLALAQCADIDLAATLLWTAKEALSKALRCGLTCPCELLEIGQLETERGYYVGYFKNFVQYKAMSWLTGRSVVTLVLPKRTVMQWAGPVEMAGMVQKLPI
jgi:4'-phosphopantetheinyl transferase